MTQLKEHRCKFCGESILSLQEDPSSFTQHIFKYHSNERDVEIYVKLMEELWKMWKSFSVRTTYFDVEKIDMKECGKHE